MHNEDEINPDEEEKIDQLSPIHASMAGYLSHKFVRMLTKPDEANRVNREIGYQLIKNIFQVLGNYSIDIMYKLNSFTPDYYKNSKKMNFINPERNIIDSILDINRFSITNLLLDLFNRLYDSKAKKDFSKKLFKQVLLPYVTKLSDTFMQDLETVMRFVDTNNQNDHSSQDLIKKIFEDFMELSLGLQKSIPKFSELFNLHQEEEIT